MISKLLLINEQLKLHQLDQPIHTICRFQACRTRCLIWHVKKRNHHRHRIVSVTPHQGDLTLIPTTRIEIHEVELSSGMEYGTNYVIFAGGFGSGYVNKGRGFVSLCLYEFWKFQVRRASSSLVCRPPILHPPQRPSCVCFSSICSWPSCLT